MKIPRLVPLLSVAFFAATAASAIEQPGAPKPPVGDPFEDKFERTTLGDQWQIGGGVYTLHDGYLTAGEKEGNNHPGIFKIWKDFKDIELKFSVDDLRFSIDVRKNFLEQLKDIYKALTMISRLQTHNEHARENALKTLDAVASMYKVGSAPSEDAVVRQFNALLDEFLTD